MNPPRIFICATSGDLGSKLQIAKEALFTIICHPVKQTNFEPDWRSVTGMLRGKIDDYGALIHLVVFRQGTVLPLPAPRAAATRRWSITPHASRDCGMGFPRFRLPDADQAGHRYLIPAPPRWCDRWWCDRADAFPAIRNGRPMNLAVDETRA